MKMKQLLPATKPALQKRDLLWKGIVEDLFADFLRFFFPNADSLFDIERGFEFLEKELQDVTPGGRIKHPRFVDKLVKLWHKDGTEKWLLLHVEVQGHWDDRFSARMFTYFYRICDKFQREITSLAIFTDDNDNYQPDRYEYNCFGTSVLFCFNTYKVRNQDAALLEQSDNPFAIVILTVLTTLQQKGGSQEQLLESALLLVRRLYEKSFPKEKIIRLLQFIKRYANFDDSGLLLKFEEEIRIITKEPDHMGIIEQVIEMEKEEVRAVGVKNLLLETDFDIQKIARLMAVDVDFVKEIKSELSTDAEGDL